MSRLSSSLAATHGRIQILLARSDTLRRLVKLIGWTLLSFGLDKGAAVIIVFLLARILGAEDYGRLTLAQGMVNTLQIVVVLGAGAVLGRYIPAVRQQGHNRAVEIINLCALLVFGTAALFLIGALTIGQTAMLGLLRLSAGSSIATWVTAWVVLSALMNLLITVLLSFERGRAMALVSLVGAIVSVTAVPIFAVRFGLAGAVIGLVAVEALKLISLAVLYGKLAADEGFSVLAKPRVSDLPLLISFGAPVFLTSALWAPTMWLAQLIVSARAPDGLSAVGVFGFTNSALGAVILISSLTNRAALPILASLQAEGRFAELRRMSSRMALGQIVAASAFSAPLVIAAPFIMSLLGPAFAGEWLALDFMIATGVMISAQTALGNYLLVCDRQVDLLYSMITWSVLVISLTLILSAHGTLAIPIALFIGAVVRTALIGLAYRRPIDNFN